MVLSRGKRIGVGAILVVLVLIIIFYTLGKNSDAVRVWLARRQEKAIQAWVNKNLEIEKEAYRNDTFGGKTPEETVALFLTAVKAGDISLASKYYELPLQDKALKNLQEEKAKYGNFEHTISYFEEVMAKGTKRCNAEGDGCTVRLRYVTDKDERVKITGTDQYLDVPAGSQSSKLIDFSINKLSHVWKISN